MEFKKDNSSFFSKNFNPTREPNESIKKDYFNGYHRWKLRDWIPFEKLDFKTLIMKPEKSLYYIEKYGYDKLDSHEWTLLSKYTPEPNIILKFLENLKLHKPQNKDEKRSKNQRFEVTREYLSGNEYAIYLLEKNQDLIDWKGLSCNPNALKLLEDNIGFIDWKKLVYNPNPECLNLLKKHDKINKKNLKELSHNKGAISLLEENQNKINWRVCSYYLSVNPNAVHLLEKNRDSIDWHALSENPSAIHLLEANQDKISWSILSANPSAIHLLEKNPDKIYWPNLASNPSAMHILEKNIKRIDEYGWRCLSMNPEIFELDYKFIYERMNIIRKELMEKTWHPNRLIKWCLDIDELKDLNN